MLFVRFFIRSYLKRSSKTHYPTKAKKVSKSSYEAVRSVEREVLKAMSRDRGSRFNSSSNSDTEITSPASPSFTDDQLDIKNEPHDSASENEDTSKISTEKAKTLLSRSKDGASDAATTAKDAVVKVAQDTKDAVQALASKSVAKAESVEEEVRKATGDTIAEVKKMMTETSEDPKNSASVEAKESRPEIKQETHRSYADATKGSGEDSQADQSNPENTDSATGEVTSESREYTRSEESEHVQEVMARSYETSFDEVTTAEQKEAEAKMQPEVVNESAAS